MTWTSISHASLLGAVAAAVIAALALTTAPASAASELFSNATPISIPTSGTASPYPSTINVQGMPGRVTDVSVSLNTFKHDYPKDVDVLLASPDGDTAIVMSDACGESTVTSNRWVFTETLGTQMPKDGPCDGSFYRPTDHPSSTADFWPYAPFATIHYADLDRFVGEQPNGDWSLFVIDDQQGDAGSIAGGWSLTLTTAVPDAVVPGSSPSGAADPYPITRTISGIDGVITDVDVAQVGIYHQRPVDLDMLLVGPHGQKAMLMSDACGQNQVKGIGWGWDDESPLMMPTSPCTGDQSYVLTDVAPGDSLPEPAPPAPYADSLSTFDLTDPNGEWRLYVADDFADSANGFLTQRFTLNIQTRARANVAFAEEAVSLAEGEATAIKLVRFGPDTYGAGTVTVTSASKSAEAGADFEPVSTTVAFEPGETEHTIPIKALVDELGEQPETFTLTIGDPTGDAQTVFPSDATVTIRDREPTSGTGSGGTTGGGDGASGAGAEPDRTAPIISRVSVKRRTVRFRLSEAAAVTLIFQRARAGRRVGTVRVPGRGGDNRVRITGRLGRRTLRPGRYRLRVVARDAAGNQSTSRARTFRIVRPAS